MHACVCACVRACVCACVCVCVCVYKHENNIVRRAGCAVRQQGEGCDDNAVSHLRLHPMSRSPLTWQ